MFPKLNKKTPNKNILEIEANVTVELNKVSGTQRVDMLITRSESYILISDK